MGNIIKGQVADNHTVSNHFDPSFKDDENLVVIADYPCRDISQPMFRMGEKLKVLSQEACWWKVRSLQTGTENYIPNNHVAKVYHGWLFEGVGRQKAEELLYLPGNTVGSFLIRESPSQRGVYSLSVRYRDIMHYKILRLDNSWYYISPRLTFQCLEDMVNHYSDSSDGICCILSAPCLALNSTTPSSVSQAPPVVMRRNFEWRKVNSWYYISPRLTFQCLEDMVNHYSDSSDGICCILSAPCLALNSTTPSSVSQAPPVVMRRNFEWRKVNRSQLLNSDTQSSVVSYGVRSSIAAYLNIAQEEERKSRRKKKGWTVYGIPDNSNMERENTN
ncbi:src like adaptor 1a [Tachysurus ichikawai]